MITVSIDSANLTRSLNELSRLMTDMSPIMRRIGDEVKGAVEKNFDTEGARIGKAWKKSYRAKLQGGKTLQDTGRLASSIVSLVESHAVTVGTNVIYGPIHQFGGTIRPVVAKRLKFRMADGKYRTAKEVTMPTRPFLGINASDEQRISDIIKAAIEKATT